MFQSLLKNDLVNFFIENKSEVVETWGVKMSWRISIFLMEGKTLSKHSVVKCGGV